MNRNVVIGLVAIFAMLFFTICYEVYAIECSKRGGDPVNKTGWDYSGDKELHVEEYKCEGEPDVRN